MSSVADILLEAQDGRLVDNTAEKLGLSPEQTEAAIRALAPALAAGLRNAAEDPGALERIVAGVAETTPHHAAFASSDAAHAEEAVEQGREILAQLFGSPDAAGKVAQIAARDSGLRADILSRLLPVLASVVLGGLFKTLNAQGLGPIFEQIVKSGGLGEILGQLGGGKAGGGAGGGLGDILDQLGRSAGTPAPQPRGGGLGGLLGGLLGALFGGGAKGGGVKGGGATGGGAAPLPGGLDPATLQAALEQLRKSLQPGGAGVGHDPELDAALEEVFGPRGRSGKG